MSWFNKRRKEAQELGTPRAPQDNMPLKMTTFEEELDALVEKYQLPALSNTPSFILAYYIKDCILAFNSVQQRRKEWFAAREEHRASQLASLHPSDTD